MRSLIPDRLYHCDHFIHLLGCDECIVDMYPFFCYLPVWGGNHNYTLDIPNYVRWFPQVWKFNLAKKYVPVDLERPLDLHNRPRWTMPSPSTIIVDWDGKTALDFKLAFIQYGIVVSTMWKRHVMYMSFPRRSHYIKCGTTISPFEKNKEGDSKINLRKRSYESDFTRKLTYGKEVTKVKSFCFKCIYQLQLVN